MPQVVAAIPLAFAAGLGAAASASLVAGATVSSIMTAFLMTGAASLAMATVSAKIGSPGFYIVERPV